MRVLLSAGFAQPSKKSTLPPVNHLLDGEYDEVGACPGSGMALVFTLSTYVHCLAGDGTASLDCVGPRLQARERDRFRAAVMA